MLLLLSLSLEAKYDTGLSPWDMALLGLLRIQIMQIVVNDSSSMKPVNVLNNFIQKYYLLRRFERYSTQGRYGKGAGKFSVKWLSRLIRLHR